MKAEHINPFILATLDVFNTMVECPLTRGNPYMKEGCQPTHEISGVIGYTGYAEGCVVISLSRQLALHATGVLLEKKCDVIDDDVMDTVGELANMVAGHAKKQFEQYDLRVSLPTVLSGKAHHIGYPQGIAPMCIPFDSNWGEVLVEFALLEVKAGAV